VNVRRKVLPPVSRWHFSAAAEKLLERRDAGERDQVERRASGEVGMSVQD